MIIGSYSVDSKNLDRFNHCFSFSHRNQPTPTPPSKARATSATSRSATSPRPVGQRWPPLGLPGLRCQRTRQWPRFLHRKKKVNFWSCNFHGVLNLGIPCEFEFESSIGFFWRDKSKQPWVLKLPEHIDSDVTFPVYSSHRYPRPKAFFKAGTKLFFRNNQVHIIKQISNILLPNELWMTLPNSTGPQSSHPRKPTEAAKVCHLRQISSGGIKP